MYTLAADSPCHPDVRQLLPEGFVLDGLELHTRPNDNQVIFAAHRGDRTLLLRCSRTISSEVATNSKVVTRLPVVCETEWQDEEVASRRPAREAFDDSTSTNSPQGRSTRNIDRVL